MSRANKTLVYIAASTMTLALMLAFVWFNAANGNTWWAVTFAGLASLNAAFAGANYVMWLAERSEP